MTIKAGLMVAVASGLVIFSAPMLAADKAMTSDEQKFSYSLGVQMGENLKRQGLTKVDVEALGQAIDDVLKGEKLKLSQEEMTKAVEAEQGKMLAARAARAEQAKVAGEAFLAANKTKPGVKTLDSGIQYKVIKDGAGKKPLLSDSVVAHYRGTLIDGREFDSSHKRGEPARFPLQNVIAGWQQVLPLMATGAKWQVFIPSSLAYGARGAGALIGPNETLIFEIELLSIDTPPAK